MRFVDIYSKSKIAVREALTSMWCSDCHNESQNAYATELKGMLDELFAPKDAMPLVQCMNQYEAVKSTTREKANQLIGGLWKEEYSPYEHQYQCWKTLSEKTTDGKVKSIVVTTGTGSGKTECFMLPLIADLKKRREENGNGAHSIQAIFLYPLNALMEDQKERLQKYIGSSELTFAVYNGNLPDRDDINDFSLHQRIIKEKKDYPSIITTRNEMRSQKVDILLTNPTMLEYMLLRDKDCNLFTSESLKWIVIDETHTYTGAAAAELAMLMRRVMIAFGVNSDNVRFATSSATIGNGEDEGMADDKLKNFICGITGQTKAQIDIIKGVRIDASKPLNDINADECKKKLFKNEYLRLDELITGDDLTIEQRLAKLDEYCDLGLKAKVHFFDKVLTQGLKVNISKRKGGMFEIFSEVPADSKPTEPYLDLMRCSSCGEYVAVGQYTEGEDTFSATTITDNDMFDFSERESKKKVVFALSKIGEISEENNECVVVNGNKTTNAKPIAGQWNLLRNNSCECPHCGARFGKNTKTGDSDSGSEIDYKTITSFRLSSDFISRTIAPKVLSALSISDGNKPHDGQQYISFVDSRQAAAKATLSQNLEEERLWVYSRIFNELTRRKTARLNQESKLKKIEELEKRRKELAEGGDYEGAYNATLKKDELREEIEEINTKQEYLTWSETFEILKNSPECDSLCEQFIKRSKGSKEFDEKTGKPTDDMKTKYVYAIMIELLGRRPASAKAPETLGLFHSYYPRVESTIKSLPKSVSDFNKLIHNEDDKINLQDWKDLLKIFLDYNVRANMSLFLHDPNHPNFDIKNDFQRFETQKQPTRPARFPSLRYNEKEAKEEGEQVGKLKYNPGNVIKLLVKLLGDDYKAMVEQHETAINAVLKDLEISMLETTKDGTDGGMLEKENAEFSDSIIRMNLTKLGFKLYEHAALCDTRRLSTRKKWPVIRPVDTLFKGMSPYLLDNEVRFPIAQEDWTTPYPYIDGKNNGVPVTSEDVINWGKTNRSLLWNYRLWGESGCFSDRYVSILSFPKIFIQAEHTAQIDKLIAKQSQEKFKARELNILACSTTMEMGIDLGNLELVMMNSIPPHPANYKQRAGRSGRDIKAVRSACITMCSSDSIGLRTLRDPIATLIDRRTEIPIVDLMSRQVIQRHINSYLLRESKVFSRDNLTSNNMDQQVIDFFTPYRFGTTALRQGKNYEDIRNDDRPVYPIDGLGDPTNTKYKEFTNWLVDYTPDDNFKRLLKGTHFDDRIRIAIDNTIDDIDRCYSELTDAAQMIGIKFNELKTELYRTEVFSSDNDFYDHINTGDKPNAKYGRSLKYKFSELLSLGLLPYLATHRFTPNANMPVNVVEFDINLNNVKKGNWNNDRPSNPSYTLQEALSQYAPGNTIILSNRARIVRGVITVGNFRDTSTFKKVFTDGTNVVIENGNESRLNNLINWPVNEKKELELIQPYAFIPDVNEPDTRHLDNSVYTRVDAQLIGAGEWKYDNGAHLISVRASEDSGEASILYYNDGIGYGYCYCPICGKMALETGASIPITPKDFDDYSPKRKDKNQDDKKTEEEKKRYHYNIQKVNQLCLSTESRKNRRNVIIGNTIQTDFCEVKIRHSVSGEWINSNNDKLTLTLAIVFTNILAERLGIEQRDIAFTIMPNGNICIYDTNPGGSGYSKRLGDLALLNDVIDGTQELLMSINSKEEILDRYTMRYRDEIDVEAAKEWVQKEIESRCTLPDVVSQHYPSAVGTNMSALIDDCSYPQKDKVVLFVTTNTNFKDWNYSDGNTNWRSRIDRIRDKSVISLNIISDANELPTPIKSMLSPATDWLSSRVYLCKNPLPNGLYPLALVDRKLFFTTEVQDAILDDNWAKRSIYCVQTSITSFDSSLKTASLEIKTGQNLLKFTIGEGDPYQVSSRTLPKLVYDKCKDVVEQFESYLNTVDKSEIITITYQDEHLKTCVAMATTLQFIEYYAFKFKRKFKLIFKVEDYSSKNDNLTESELTVQKELPQQYRDQRLNEMIDEWCDVIVERGLNVTAEEISPLPQKELPHWRVLSFRCGTKQLDFYPNGGIINEWYLGNNNSKHFTYDNISCKDDIKLSRRKNIMYDVELKDVE